MLLKIIRTLLDDRDLFKILSGRWRRNLPFKSRSAPRIIPCFFTLKKAMEKIAKHHDQPGDENPRAKSSCQMKGPKLREIVVISSGHSFPAQQEHGEIEDIKSDEHNHPCPYCRFPVIHPAKHLREPVMKGCEKAKSHPAEDDVVKMAWYPVGIVEVHIGCQCPLDQACKSTDRKEKDKGETEEERGFDDDRAFVQSRNPVEDLDCAGNGHQKGEKGEKNVSKITLAADKHVMAPDERPDCCDRHARKGDGHISKNLFPGKNRDHIRDDPHRRKDHDIGCWVGVNPEHMLVQDGIASLGRVKYPHSKKSFEKDENHGDSDYRSGKYLNPRRCVDRPYKKG